MKGRFGAAPKHDLHFVEQSARREPHRERARIEIERAAGVEDACRSRPARNEADLPMRDVDETMRGPLEHGLQHVAGRRCVGVVRDQQPLVGPEPQCGAFVPLAHWPKSRRQVGAERHAARNAHGLASA